MTTPAGSAAEANGRRYSIPPLTSFECLREDWHVDLNSETRRLRWSLDGPIENAVYVMRHAYYDPDDPPPEPFYCPPTDENGVETWHDLAELPLYIPGVSSVKMRVSCLREWAINWEMTHFDFGGQEYEDGPTPPDSPGTDENPTPQDDEVTIHASTEGSYVTIRDFVTAVHPKLMGLREELLIAAGSGWNETSRCQLTRSSWCLRGLSGPTLMFSLRINGSSKVGKTRFQNQTCHLGGATRLPHLIRRL